MLACPLSPGWVHAGRTLASLESILLSHYVVCRQAPKAPFRDKLRPLQLSFCCSSEEIGGL